LPEIKPKHPTEWRLLILDEASSYDTEEFIWICYNNRVQLLFLPAHTSHKTQPLDRSVFSPIKNYFRQNTKALAHCRNSAPANKQRFLLCYRDASRRGCNVPNIRSSFRKTGIWPFNPSAILDDRKALVGDAPPPRPRTPTPEIAPTAELQLVKAPKKAQDVRQVVNSLKGRVSPSCRTVKHLLNKVGKALDLANAEKAGLEAEINRLEEDFRAARPYTQKRVREAPNDKFARIEDIAQAEEASREPPTRRRRVTQQEAIPAVEQAQEEIIHGLDRLRGAQEML